MTLGLVWLAALCAVSTIEEAYRVPYIPLPFFILSFFLRGWLAVCGPDD